MSFLVIPAPFQRALENISERLPRSCRSSFDQHVEGDKLHGIHVINLSQTAKFKDLKGRPDDEQEHNAMP